MFTLSYKFKNNSNSTTIEFSDMEEVKEFLDEDFNISDISDIDKVKLLQVISEYMYLLSKYMDTETHLMSFLIDLNKAF